jgi:2,3-bisphosphoglycerate-dependent phosphoglycerate mutase
MSVEIVFETHSWSVDNERGIATGWLPGELSERGKREAQKLGVRRRENGIAVVYTSDLTRAVETAEIAFAGSGIAIYRDARLRECDYGELNGAPRSEVDAVRLRHVDEPFPGGESWRQAVERVRDFLDELARTRDGERVLLIGHAATRFALDHLLDGKPLEEVVEPPFEWQEGWEYRIACERWRDASASTTT